MKRKKNIPWPLVSAAVFLAVVLIFTSWLDGFTEDSRQRQKEALETALNRNLLICYTLEGRYPETLEEILEKYPVTYDKNLFFIDYRLQGANILPEIAVLDMP